MMFNTREEVREQEILETEDAISKRFNIESQISYTDYDWT